MVLDTINDDTLILIFSFLSVPDILVLRQTSKRMLSISKLRIVWHNACTSHVLRQGFPFPGIPLDSTEPSELEHRTRHAYRLGRKWLSSTSEPRTTLAFDANSSTTITDVRFVPGPDGVNWLLTVSKGIWSVVTAWDIGSDSRKMSSWSLKGAVFNGLAVAFDSNSGATLALSVLQDGRQRIDLLLLSCQGDNPNATFQPVTTIESSHKPKTLQGDFLAISDDFTETTIWNWKEHTCAALRHPEEPVVGRWGYNRCIQIVFAHRSILVVRARSIHLFPEPTLQTVQDCPVYEPMARHSFGWIDGVSVALNKHSTMTIDDDDTCGSLSILIRAESDDPWAANNHTLDMYILEPSPSLLSSSSSEDLLEGESAPMPPPYIFPPSLSAQVQSVRGSLRCTDLVLGRHGTAIWLHPQDRAASGLISSGVHLQDIPAPNLTIESESLVGAVFPGPLCSQSVDIEARCLWSNAANDWTSLDYDEELGRIALGSSFGRVTILEL